MNHRNLINQFVALSLATHDSDAQFRAVQLDEISESLNDDELAECSARIIAEIATGNM